MHEFSEEQQLLNTNKKIKKYKKCLIFLLFLVWLSTSLLLIFSCSLFISCDNKETEKIGFSLVLCGFMLMIIPAMYYMCYVAFCSK